MIPDLPPHISRLLERLERSEKVLLVTHHDADGVSSAGVLLRSLSDRGVDVLVLRQLYPEVLEKMPIENYDFVVFTDLGGRYANLIESRTDAFLVVDHHDDMDDSPHVFSPRDLGYDPSIEASSSTLAALISYRLEQDPRTLVYGLVGAAGDQQFERGSFTGLNRVYVREGVVRGELTIVKDLVLPGIRFKPIAWSLYYSDPFLPGVTGNDEAIYDILERAGILQKYGPEVVYTDLSMEDRRSFVTTLILYLIRSGWSPEKAKSIIGEVYEIVGNYGWVGTVRSLSSLSNAMGKLGRTDLIGCIYLDRFECLPEAEKVLVEYRKGLVEAIIRAKEVYEDLGSFIFVDGRGKIPYYSTGMVASVISRETGKPTLVVVDDGPYVKGSLRGGKNLSRVVSILLERVRGEGGGHPEAAGFRVLEEDLSKVLDLLSNLSSDEF